MDTTEDTAPKADCRKIRKWPAADVATLLKLCITYNIGQRITSEFAEYRNLSELLGEAVIPDMKNVHGLTYTNVQIQHKFQSMKNKYHQLRIGKRSGCPPRWKFYNLCETLFQGKAPTNRWNPTVYRPRDADGQTDEENSSEDEEGARFDPLVEDEVVPESFNNNTFVEQCQVPVTEEENLRAMFADFQSSQKTVLDAFFDSQKEMLAKQREWHKKMISEERAFFVKVLESALKQK